ncbi:MAG: ParB/RepB/Spo0J family partition protein [Pseudomonadota bacterium]
MAVAAAKKSNMKGLGRGLGALLGDAPATQAATASETTEPPRELPIEYLQRNSEQPRRVFDEDAINELAESIKSRGLLQPILVRELGPQNYEIVAGERRWRASQKAQLHTVPVVIRALSDEEAAEIALIENVQRVDLSPVEEAAGYRRLIDAYGRSQEEIAKAVGKSRSHVANMIRLLKLPEKVLDALNSGGISMGHARALLSAPDPDAACARVLKDGLSVRDTEKLVKQSDAPSGSDAEGGALAKGNAKASSGGKKDADTKTLERDLSAALGLEVEIDHKSKGAGAVTIRYLDLDQLDDVCRRLMGVGA